MASGSGFTNRIQKARFWRTKWIGPGLQQYLGRKHHIWEFQKKTGKENSAKTTIHLGYPTCWKKRQWGELWCQSSMPFKKNEMISVRTYMRIYVYTYIINNIMYMYIQKKDSLFNATILEICAERHKKRTRFSQIMPLQRTHTVLKLEIYYSLFQPSWCPWKNGLCIFVRKSAEKPAVKCGKKLLTKCHICGMSLDKWMNKVRSWNLENCA